jgi:hypothetical protein
MAKLTTKPVGKKAVAVISSSKPKTSKAAVVTIAKSPVAKNPAVKKPDVIKPAVKISLTKTTEKKSKPAVNHRTVVKPSPEERYRMVELAAYFIAEQHGFQGRTDEYWAAAEQQIAATLNP